DRPEDGGLPQVPLPARRVARGRAVSPVPLRRGGLQDALPLALLVSAAAYPWAAAERDRWILDRRGQRNALDPRRAYAALTEEEPDGSGGTLSVSTIFLTNRECPWRCLMCDLWTNTLTEPVPEGAIPAQIAYALPRLPPARW